MALAKLTIKPEKGSEIQAMYNPREFTLETRNQYQRTSMPGLPTPITQFVSGETQKISLELFFDTFEIKEDVRQHTRQITNLLKIDRDLHAPPVCEFLWGGSMAGDIKSTFKGVIDSVSQKFTMFLDTGIPVRATLSVSISEYQTIEEQLVKLGLQSADRTKYRVFQQKDNLCLVAHREYDDPALWREIARANNIDNPRTIETGTELVIPPLE